MNHEASQAMIRATENQFAIPAQEATKQSVEETRRFKYRAFMYPPVLTVSVIAMAVTQNGSAKWIACATIAVMGSVEGVQFLDRWLARRNK